MSIDICMTVNYVVVDHVDLDANISIRVGVLIDTV